MGDTVAFKIQDGKVFDVAHQPAEPDDGPAATAAVFNDLLNEIKEESLAGDEPPPTNGRSSITSVTMHITLPSSFPQDDYYHPLMADVARLVSELRTYGVKPGRSLKFALEAARLAAGEGGDK
jgi:hypothetical protein